MINVSEICIFSHTNLANVCTFPTPQKQSINRSLCYLHLFLILDDAYRQCTCNQQNTCHNHHIALMRTHQTQDSSTADGSISLLSHRVEFVHPVSKETIVAEAPLPDDNLWRAIAP